MSSHRDYLLAFFRNSLNAIESETVFRKKVEIMTNMYGVMNSNFEFLSSDEWTSSDASERFLKATYDKVLEGRESIYRAMEVNFDINNQRRISTYYPIYDDCLNVLSEYEKKYLEYFEEKLEEWTEEFEQAPTEPWVLFIKFTLII